MKLYTVKRIFPLLLCTLIFNSCDDEKMQWGKIGGEITAEEIPLELTEKIERYDFIKTYAAQYTPQMCIGIGLSANLYNTDEEYKQVCDDNFQLFTMGNAMKHGTVVRDNGELNFTTIDKFFNIIPEDKQIYGHNFIWHTQQNQNYLKKLVVEALGNEGEITDPSVTATYTTQLKYTQNATPRAISSSLRNNEKIQTALYGAMENWIKEMIKHCGKRVTAWDVLNEPINDDLGLRGVDNKYASGDSEPTGSTASDLNLNWISSAGNQHFYWGYFLGKEYAVKAFQYARKYANEQQTDAKLYINDYNLESNPNKLKELIEYVKYIDEQNGSPIVDGIGTQMHVNVDLKKSQVDAMFKTMASTGKLIRITELDVAVKTTTPSIEQQQSQADTYLMIVESYKENVPEVQQAGITIWNLTDSKKEHEYWLNGDAPNLFNADYSRKIAYKAFCDGLAGKDISEDWEKPMNK